MLKNALVKKGAPLPRSLAIGLLTRGVFTFDEAVDWSASITVELLVEVEGSCSIGESERGRGFGFVSGLLALFPWLSFGLADEPDLSSSSSSKAVLRKKETTQGRF